MKKFLIFLLLLLILGGAGFYFGWAQFQVPPGSFGVMRSKTHGTDPRLVKEGEFRWVWYKLIPSNVEIRIFTPRTVTHSVKTNGSLPSGTVYAELAGINADFSWEIIGDISFSIKPDALPSLVQAENLNSQEDLALLEDNYARQIEALILKRLAEYGENAQIIEDILLANSLASLNVEIEAAYPALDQVNCRIQAVRYPDFRLYQSAQGLYDEYLAHQREMLTAGVAQKAEDQMGTRLRLDELEKYGEILTRYPILLQYLALEKGISPATPIQ